MANKKVSQIDASASEFMTLGQFQKEIIPWSDKTIKKYIKEAGMPAIQTSSNTYVFDRKAVREWFKRFTYQAS